jgi:hypothetical protein
MRKDCLQRVSSIKGGPTGVVKVRSRKRRVISCVNQPGCWEINGPSGTCCIKNLRIRELCSRKKPEWSEDSNRKDPVSAHSRKAVAGHHVKRPPMDSFTVTSYSRRRMPKRFSTTTPARSTLAYSLSDERTPYGGICGLPVGSWPTLPYAVSSPPVLARGMGLGTSRR